MILTVTPNPALDMTWVADGLVLGSTHRVVPGSVRAGGKGLNVARVLHSRHNEVVALTTAGGSTGADFAAELERSAVPHALVQVAGSTRRSVAIVDHHVNQTTVINETGCVLSDDERQQFTATARSLAESARAVAICGSMPPNFTDGALADLIAAVRGEGRPVLVDTSGTALLAAADAGAAALKPNEHELREATGEDRLDVAARMLLDRGATVVVVSQGERGLFIMHRDGRAVSARLDHVVVGNATGAGDAVSAAIVAALAADPSLANLDLLARRATAWGAAAVAMPLAGEISDDADAWQDIVTVKPISGEEF